LFRDCPLVEGRQAARYAVGLLVELVVWYDACSRDVLVSNVVTVNSLR